MGIPVSRRTMAILLPASTVLGGTLAALAAEPLRIAAAASFRQALDDIIAAYQKQGGQRVVATYGATGNLVGQIVQGAPFDLLLAADEESTARLAAASLTTAQPDVLVQGRISLIVPRGSKLTFGQGFMEPGAAPGAALLRAAFEAGQIQRFAIANPELAPYGRAGREALEKLDLLALAKPRFVYGENVGQVAQYVATGAAEAGITAHALTTAEPLASALRASPISQSLHAPIRQTFVVLKRGGAGAAEFGAFLKGADAGAIFERHGFAKP